MTNHMSMIGGRARVDRLLRTMQKSDQAAYYELDLATLLDAARDGDRLMTEWLAASASVGDLAGRN